MTMTQQATTFMAEGHVPTAGTIAQKLHRALMGGTPTLHNTGVRGDGIGGTTGTESAPLAATEAGQHQLVGRGSTGWSALTEAVTMVGLAATMQDFSKKLLKCQADVDGESTKCATFKTQTLEAANLWVFVGMVN